MERLGVELWPFQQMAKALTIAPQTFNSEGIKPIVFWVGVELIPMILGVDRGGKGDRGRLYGA